MLWLKNPPQLAGIFCRLVLLQMMLDNLTFGHMSGIMASGKIKWYQITTGTLCVLSVPVAWLVLELGGNPESVSWVIAGCMAACSATRLYFGKNLLGIEPSRWVRSIFIPLMTMTIASCAAGYSVQFILEEPTFMRLCLTGIVAAAVMFVVSWKLLFDQAEKAMFHKVFSKITSKF